MFQMLRLADVSRPVVQCITEKGADKGHAWLTENNERPGDAWVCRDDEGHGNASSARVR